MKKKHVLILFTVLALSVTSVMKLIPVSKVAASSILGGNKNESILDKLTPTPEPGKSDKKGFPVYEHDGFTYRPYEQPAFQSRG